MKKAEEKGVKLLLPTDVVVADAFAADAQTQTVSVDAIPDGWMGLDIGPDSVKSFQDELNECKSVIWNGPMGVFEMDAFAKGTFAIADTLAELDGITIIGGGDSVAAVEKAGPRRQDVAHLHRRRRLPRAPRGQGAPRRRRPRRGVNLSQQH
jgi:phosphoglycerate kinase